MESPGAGVLVWVDRFQLPLACLASAVVCFIMGAVVGGKFWALAFSAMLLTALVSGVVIAIRVATATAAPVVELSTVPVSDDVRSRNLQAAIAHDVAATAGRVETVTPFTAVLAVGRPVNHVLHLLVSVLLCGLWLPVWALIAASGGERRSVLTVDGCGNVSRAVR